MAVAAASAVTEVAAGPASGIEAVVAICLAGVASGGMAAEASVADWKAAWAVTGSG